MYKISIITVNLNNVTGLKRTVDSVLSQTYKNIEYLVIDGASKDGSAELITTYHDKISFSISEPDSGIYNAMNKGISKAKGDYLLFLNSGDTLSSVSAIEKAVSHIVNEDIVYGSINFIDDKGTTHERTYPKKLSFNFFLKDTLPHPASLIKRKLFNDIGLYDETLRICSDYKFFLDATCKFNCTTKYIHETIANFWLDGISSIASNNELLQKEKYQILNNEYALFMYVDPRIEKYDHLVNLLKHSGIIKLCRSLGFLKAVKLES